MDVEILDIEFIGPKERFDPGKELFLPTKYSNAYLVGNLGSVYSFKSHKLLKQTRSNCGYTLVSLVINGKRRTFTVHRLVAETWIPNPENLSDVSHKNDNKADNRVENLEWLSHKDNLNYGTRNQKISKTRKQNRYAYLWFNNGIYNKRFKETDEIPEGFKRGMLKRAKKEET